MAVDGQGGINDLLHPATDTACVLDGHLVPDVEVHIVTVAHRDVDGHLALLIQVVDSLAEHEEERAGVGP